ncbi:MAG: CooT family nickel-binding protein [Methanomassiliicoccales archaeon]|nr:CooT family nickel-binding protein [Methanomassiliicoccales archaeon]
MCESVVFLEEGDEVKEVLKDVARVVVDDGVVTCTSIIGERVTLMGVRLKEANFISHGIVFVRD